MGKPQKLRLVQTAALKAVPAPQSHHSGPTTEAIIECRGYQNHSMHHCALLQQHSSRLACKSSRLSWQLRRLSCSPAKAAGHQHSNGTGELDWWPVLFCSCRCNNPVLTTERFHLPYCRDRRNRANGRQQQQQHSSRRTQQNATQVSAGGSTAAPTEPPTRAAGPGAAPVQAAAPPADPLPHTYAAV